jgi:DNA-binding response OmpR family regulator
MKILIAEDDATSRTILENVLTRWGYEVTSTKDGEEAWAKLQEPDTAALLVLDWMMPKMDGLEVCRRIRRMEKPDDRPFYIILLTGRNTKEDIVMGLEAGANDYITKPFDKDELKARINVGRRVIELQTELTRHVKELENALEHIKTLQGILPICSYCKKIRDDQNYWQQVETYIAQFTDARFSHSICPDCFERHVKPQLKKFEEEEE